MYAYNCKLASVLKHDKLYSSEFCIVLTELYLLFNVMWTMCGFTKSIIRQTLISILNSYFSYRFAVIDWYYSTCVVSLFNLLFDCITMMNEWIQLSESHWNRVWRIILESNYTASTVLQITNGALWTEYEIWMSIIHQSLRWIIHHGSVTVEYRFPIRNRLIIQRCAPSTRRMDV